MERFSFHSFLIIPPPLIFCFLVHRSGGGHSRRFSSLEREWSRESRAIEGRAKEKDPTHTQRTGVATPVNDAPECSAALSHEKAIEGSTPWIRKIRPPPNRRRTGRARFFAGLATFLPSFSLPKWILFTAIDVDATTTAWFTRFYWVSFCFQSTSSSGKDCVTTSTTLYSF